MPIDNTMGRIIMQLAVQEVYLNYKLTIHTNKLKLDSCY